MNAFLKQKEKTPTHLIDIYIYIHVHVYILCNTRYIFSMIFLYNKVFLFLSFRPEEKRPYTTHVKE